MGSKMLGKTKVNAINPILRNKFISPSLNSLISCPTVKVDKFSTAEKEKPLQMKSSK